MARSTTLEEALYAAAQQWARDNHFVADRYALGGAMARSNVFRWKFIGDRRLRTEFVWQEPL